jgi:hypothetical protein
MATLAAAFILVVADYIKDWRWLGGKIQLDEQEIIFGVIGGAIQLAADTQGNKKQRNPDHYFSDLLKSIESVTKIVLGQSEAQGVKISANLMIPRNQPVDTLKLEYWGTRLDGREDITLQVDNNSPTPGAVAAYVTRKPIYIPNTMLPVYKDHFDPEKDYRSIISIPVKDSGGNVYGVVNIDSNVEELFGSMEVISTNLIPKIKPLINLIVLKRDLLKKRDLDKQRASR